MASISMTAVDVGAESGLVARGQFDGERLSLDSIHRFANTPVLIDGRLHWDALRLFSDMLDGLRGAGPFASVGVDTWGVDFALVDRSGRMLANPVHYRDRRTQGIVGKANPLVTAVELYTRTGIQILEINTIYQLLAMRLSEDPLLDTAEELVMMPALFTSWLCGVTANELTDVSTTACYDVARSEWAFDLLARFGIPHRLFRDVSRPGTSLACVRRDLDLPNAQVVTTATHDTASAVVAVPFESNRPGAYISSGTWSLVGLESPVPMAGPEAMAAGLTNEAGVDGTVRVLKNVMGLWLLQQCRRAWARTGLDLSYEELARLAEDAPAFAALIDPDDPDFLRSDDMPSAINSALTRSGQRAASTVEEFVRCVLESLALKYRFVVRQLEAVSGTTVEVIHVVGGGARNRLLCQMTADATGKQVVAGPIEATAIGNILVQARALGLVASLSEARDVVRRSFALETYQPAYEPRWVEAGERLYGAVAS